MSEKPTSLSWLMVAAAIVVGMLAYALSIGPVAWLISRAVPPAVAGIMIVIYIPLIIAAQWTEPTRDLLDWYVHLWAENVTFGM